MIDIQIAVRSFDPLDAFRTPAAEVRRRQGPVRLGHCATC
ncbi:hypothetical protein [Nonomuraea sp. NPDC049695]